MPYPIWGLDAEQWNVANVIGTWVSGIGTLTAAGLALYLANRANSQRAAFKVQLVHLVSSAPMPDRGKPFVQFLIVNTGERPLTVEQIGWRAGRFRNVRIAIQTLSGVTGDSPLPVTLEHGQTARWLIRLDEKYPSAWERELIKAVFDDPGRMRLSTLRGVAYTTIGTRFVATPAKGIIRRLRDTRF
jgi:hypothetical protein